MWTSTPLVVTITAICCRSVLGLGETFGAEMMAAVKPVPEAYDVKSVVRANGTVIRDSECKNCPYGNCINFGWIPAGLTAPFQCFTQGETVGNTKIWLRYAFGTRQDEFCYINTFDMEASKGDFTVDLPYCGTKSELSFYLPTQKVKTILYTECSLCPWRDCEGLKFYQSGASLDVNCQVADGWNQLGPLYPNGTKKYYRTSDNCYVSANTVEDLVQKAPTIPPTSTRPANLMQEPLPHCGPVPHLKAVNRPGLLEGSPPLPSLAKPATPLALAPAPMAPPAQKPQNSPKPALQESPTPHKPTAQESPTLPKPAAQKPQEPPRAGTAKTVPLNSQPAPSRSTPAGTPQIEEEEESVDEEESLLKLVKRTVSIIRAPSASCWTCPRAWCRVAERLSQRQKTEVHCSTTPGSRSQFLRTANSCYVHGMDTDLSKDEAMKLPKCS